MGICNAAWWPAIDQSPALRPLEKYGADTFKVDLVGKTVTVTRAVVQPNANELAIFKAGFTTEIDVAVSTSCAPKQRYLVEYQRRETQARTYLNEYNANPAAGPALAVPMLIAGFAVAAGLTAYQAAKLTVSQADDLYAKLDGLANLRMRKYEVDRASTAEQAQQLRDEIIAAIKALAATIT